MFYQSKASWVAQNSIRGCKFESECDCTKLHGRLGLALLLVRLISDFNLSLLELFF